MCQHRATFHNAICLCVAGGGCGEDPRWLCPPSSSAPSPAGQRRMFWPASEGVLCEPLRPAPALPVPAAALPVPACLPVRGTHSTPVYGHPPGKVKIQHHTSYRLRDSVVQVLCLSICLSAVIRACPLARSLFVFFSFFRVCSFF